MPQNAAQIRKSYGGKMQQLIIVSGMSGAGKSQALKVFEDLGFYCVDNLLPQLIIEVAKTVGSGSMQDFDKVALVVDSRGGEFFRGIYSILDLLRLNGINYGLLFLDARDSVLINRYKETRRYHPLAPKDVPSVGVALERKMLAPLKKMADEIIDTSEMSVKQLKQEIYTRFSLDKSDADVNIISFGFKRGIPPDSDFVYDCRFLPNPFNIESLKQLTGLDKPVADYVSGQEKTAPFIKNIVSLIKTVIEDYKQDVKKTLVLSIGCTGGKHRSVAVAFKINELLNKAGIVSILQHRDIYID